MQFPIYDEGTYIIECVPKCVPNLPCSHPQGGHFLRHVLHMHLPSNHMQSCTKQNSYLKASFFLSLCRMRTSVFWHLEHLTDRSISKRNAKSDIAPRVEKSSTSKAFHAHDTWFYCVWVWMETLSLTIQHWKNAGVRVWIQLRSELCNFLSISLFL